MGLVDSGSQNHGFNRSVIKPMIPQFLDYRKFCIDILTKCLTVLINKVVILVRVVRLTLGSVFGMKI